MLDGVSTDQIAVAGVSHDFVATGRVTAVANGRYIYTGGSGRPSSDDRMTDLMFDGPSMAHLKEAAAARGLPEDKHGPEFQPNVGRRWPPQFDFPRLGGR